MLLDPGHWPWLTAVRWRCITPAMAPTRLPGRRRLSYNASRRIVIEFQRGVSTCRFRVPRARARSRPIKRRCRWNREITRDARTASFNADDDSPDWTSDPGAEGGRGKGVVRCNLTVGIATEHRIEPWMIIGSSWWNSTSCERRTRLPNPKVKRVQRITDYRYVMQKEFHGQRRRTSLSLSLALARDVKLLSQSWYPRDLLGSLVSGLRVHLGGHRSILGRNGTRVTCRNERATTARLITQTVVRCVYSRVSRC